MANSTCASCDGRGFLVADDGSTSTCHHVIIARWVSTVRSTPGLENVSRLGRGLATPSQVDGSALIRGTWQLVIEDIAGWVFAHLRDGLRKKVFLTSCAELRSLYLGGEEDRSGSQLSTLRSYDLVVVRLLGIGNKLTPDAVLETLGLCRAVWLVHAPGKAYEKGHPAWSPEIEDLISSWQRIDLDGSTPGGVLKKLGLEIVGGAK